MTPETRAMLDRIIKARQLLLQDGAPVDGLSVRLHPSDYMTLGLEAGHGSIVYVDRNTALTVLRMPLDCDHDLAPGSPVVERAKEKVR